ncbi:MAG TPA: sugar phosphorylase [Anaerolineales bacterium]|nr:sugar phosphorylase [Anaerolineales bacterium]
MADLSAHLAFLYGADQAPRLSARVEGLIAAYRGRIQPGGGPLSERDSILITYPDQVRSPSRRPLQTLDAFCQKYLSGVLSGIHILPFYPSTSDDGFSVTDYRRVDSALGDWNDILSLGSRFRLMFDGVINHVSSQSEWFQGFLQDDRRYRDYFITVEGEPDLSGVVRPRALPLLTTFKTPSGRKRVWTTFSADQVDLNYRNPEVLLEILDVLLAYAGRGATFIRLDAIAYLWKEIGTACIHLPQTHHVIQFLRAAANQVAPQVQFITETNVRHIDNISYFGDGTNEAQLVYNFALPPLTLHAFQRGQARLLSDWARTLTPPSDQTTFFNFLASHDGIGLEPVRGILAEADIDALVEGALAHGGLISYKGNAARTQSPYELNINYFDSLSDPGGGEPAQLQVSRFIASQAIMLSLAGVPGIYFHSLFGSRGWPEGAQRTGRQRALNREKLQLDELQDQLADEHSLRSRVFRRYRQLLKARSSSPAFHPHGVQKILDVHPSVFALERISPDGRSHAVCFHNVSPGPVPLHTDYELGTDLLTGQRVRISDLTLEPYQILWIKL